VQTILYVVLIFPTIFGALAISLFATWLLFHRLRRRAKTSMNFLTWLKHLFEAVMGL
jgi:hypothetical protein